MVGVKPTPTDPNRRIRSVDRIRGFALFGVLLVNMFNFGANSDEWTGLIDRCFMAIKHGLFETKSLRLFAMLFGFGFYLQMKKAAGGSGSFPVFFVRRLLILFAIGMAHALLYDGDILMKYAALGLFLIPFRSLSPRALVVLAIVLLAAFRPATPGCPSPTARRAATRRSCSAWTSAAGITRTWARRRMRHEPMPRRFPLAC